MLGNISGTGAMFAYQARTADTGAAPELTPPQQRAQEALNTLKRANFSQKQQRKGAAQAKVERLKKELENLKLMSGGDPKAVARRAAQISRELASAAKEYAASGGRAGLGLGGGPEGQPQQAEGQPQAAPEAADPQQATADTFRQQAADIQQKGAEGEADAKFAADVRRLHAQAKSLVAEQRRRARQQQGNDVELERMAKNVDADGAEIDQIFSDGTLAAVTVPLVIQT